MQILSLVTSLQSDELCSAKYLPSFNYACTLYIVKIWFVKSLPILNIAGFPSQAYYSDDISDKVSPLYQTALNTGCKELRTGLIGNTMCEICRSGVTVKTHLNKYFYCALWYLSFCLYGKFVFLMCRLYLSSYCVECICLPICKCICLRPTWPRRTKREICRRRSGGSQFE